MSVLERGQQTGGGAGKGLEIIGRRAKAGAPAPLTPTPRARLLPPEVGRRKREKALRRRVWLAVLVVAVVALAGSGGAVWYAGESAMMLGEAQAQSAMLQKKVSGFSDVKAAKADLTARRAAQMVGGAGDVDWGGYLRTVQATLPAGVTVTDVSVRMSGTDPASTATTPVPATATTPTVATLTFAAETPSIPSIPDWIEALSTAPGFIAARPGTVSYDDTKGVYAVSVSIDIGASALSYKYVPKPKEAAK